MEESMKNRTHRSLQANKIVHHQFEKIVFQDAVFENFCFVTRSKRNYSSHLKKKWHNGKKLYRNPSPLSTDSIITHREEYFPSLQDAITNIYPSFNEISNISSIIDR